jgi:GR25 family glycosyltransferase involved in LPS biosynthesis
MAYLGHYINLDRSTDRRVAMEAQLARLDPVQRYHRFAAIDENAMGFTSAALTASELGCFTSHYKLLRQHLDSTEHLHILEDDAVLAKRTAEFVEWIIASGMLDDHDLLFTDMAPPSDFNFLCEARSRYASHIRRTEDGTATNIRFSIVPYFACMASYLVNRRSIGLLHDILERELASGARSPIDLLIRDKVAAGALRARCLFPFITSVAPGKFTSTIRPNDHDKLSLLAVDLLRHSFFVECNPAATLDVANQSLPDPGAGLYDRLLVRLDECDLAAVLDVATQNPPGSRAGLHDRLLARAFGYITSDAFRPP